MRAGDTRLAWLAPTAAAAVAVAHGLLLYGSSGRDDVHATYHAARALAESGSIVNFNGEVVEQSSSLLHVLLLAAVHRLSGLSLPAAGYLVSMLAGVVAIFAAWRLARHTGVRSAWVVAALLALYPFLVYWSCSGFEASLVAALSTLLPLSLINLLAGPVSPQRLALPVVLVCAFVALRPEAPIVLVVYAIPVTGVVLAAGRRTVDGRARFLDRSVKLTVVGISGLAAVVAVAGWRLAVFGQIFPQPVYAKADGLSLGRILDGSAYLFALFRSAPSLALLGLFVVAAAMVVWRRGAVDPDEPMRRVLVLGLAAALLAFVVASGGDWMEGGRFVVPALPLLAVAALWVVERLHRPVAVVMITILMVGAAVDAVRFARTRSTGARPDEVRSMVAAVLVEHPELAERFSYFETANRVHLRDAPSILHAERTVATLLAAGQQPVFLMSSQMGMVAYHLVGSFPGKVQFLDTRALVTRHFTGCSATSGLARGRLGLELGYDYYFNHAGRIEGECGIPRPHLIFSLFNRPLFDLVTSNGYTVVYMQSGEVAGGPGPHAVVGANQLIAVRDDLRPLLAEATTVYSWPSPESGYGAVPKGKAPGR